RAAETVVRDDADERRAALKAKNARRTPAAEKRLNKRITVFEKVAALSERQIPDEGRAEIMRDVEGRNGFITAARRAVVNLSVGAHDVARQRARIRRSIG